MIGAVHYCKTIVNNRRKAGKMRYNYDYEQNFTGLHHLQQQICERKAERGADWSGALKGMEDSC